MIVSVYELGLVAYDAACRLQEALAAARAGGIAGDSLLLLQHPPVITVGRGGGWQDVLVPPSTLQRAGVRVLPTDRGGRATYHGPGQLVAYPILELPDDDLHAYLWKLEEVAIRVLAGYGLAGGRSEASPGVWLGRKKIAAIGLAVRQGVTRHGVALNVAPNMAHFDLLVPCGLAGLGVTSLAQELGRAPDLEMVGCELVAAFSEVFGREVVWADPATLADVPGLRKEPLVGPTTSGGRLPDSLSLRGLSSDRKESPFPEQRSVCRSPKALASRKTDLAAPVAPAEGPRPSGVDPVQPRWLWRPISPQAEAVVTCMSGLLEGLALHTVCQEACCPNLAECYGQGTATFLILGDRCTRGCRFCAVHHGRPAPPDAGEPGRVAEAASRLGLRHVVVTSVTRDDLPDGGAGHFVACIQALRRVLPGASVEVLVPDLAGSLASLDAVLQAGPDVLNHNVETVPRLYPTVRPGADYRRSLALLARAKVQRPRQVTKSGLMLGLGERTAEVVQVLRDLRRAGCDLLTLGQYLQPGEGQLPVARYLSPEEFQAYDEKAQSMGFRGVASGPLVRSSHQAEALWAAARVTRMP